MESREAAKPWGETPPSFDASAAVLPALPAPSHTLTALLWAGCASTLHRIRRGEGVLLAVNLSLIAVAAPGFGLGLAQSIVSVLVLGLMYAFNDLCDAPTDANNPKKDHALIAVYLEHRALCTAATFALKAATIAFAAATLGTRAALAAAAVMVVNVLYSTVLKGVPVIDVVWCGLWGALYAAIVCTAPRLVLFVGLMTAVCHLYQTLDDRVSDAANGITTTAVRSPALSVAVLAILSLLLCLALVAPLGGVWALSGLTPLALYFAAGRPLVGWILTKAYFAVVWLTLLGLIRAAG